MNTLWTQAGSVKETDRKQVSLPPVPKHRRAGVTANGPVKL